MKKPWFQYFLAYTMWMVFTVAGLLFLMTSRTSLLSLLNLYYVQGKYQRSVQINFLDKVYLLAVAFIILILMIVVEEYFKHGVQKGVLARRLCRVFGFEVLFLFFSSVASAFLVGFYGLVLLLLFVELAASLGMIYLSFKLPDVKKKPNLLHRDD